jgi:N-acetyl-alpha-D-muramate 1-phosphate uridylyltransferase
MKAMILAAGRGERMRPLTDTCPKPLLEVGGKPLIVHHLEKLHDIGVREVVINYAWLGEQIEHTLGSGEQFGVSIRYSSESPEALETAGGIVKALPLLGAGKFLLINGDVYSDFNFADMNIPENSDAHVVLVDNPEHNPEGDFALNTASGKISGDHDSHAPRLTYSGIGVYDTCMFAHVAPGKRPLYPLLQAAIQRGAMSGQYYSGQWSDVGTVARLQDINEKLKS